VHSDDPTALDYVAKASTALERIRMSAEPALAKRTPCRRPSPAGTADASSASGVARVCTDIKPYCRSIP
jgi:mevalonate pyrophosphate decarboxylase